MENLINKRVRTLQGSGIRKIAGLAEREPDVINLTLGQPDFPTPDYIKRAAKRSLDQNHTAYTNSLGVPELRNSVSQYVKRKYNLCYASENEILITSGASQAIDIALRTILDEGTEVILPVPNFPAYEPVIRLCGAVPIYLDTRENGFKINAAMIRGKITENTRCIILSYPSNPTGAVLDEQDILEIANLLKEKNIFVLSDEIYSELIYEKKHQSIASIPEMKEKSIVINGLSKSHSMTGWRLGFLMAPSYLISEMAKVHLFNVTCASSITQYAAIEALTQDNGDVESMKQVYKKRRDYLYDRVVAMGLEVRKPEGAFYLFPSIKKLGMTSMEFALKLLEEEKVAVVPGDAFSEAGEGYIRMSYARSMEELEKAADRLELFLRKNFDTASC